MKRLTALLTLTFFLAACGGTAPPPEPPPVTEPGIPVAPVVPIEPVEPTPPEQPISDVPYYGEWIVTYTSEYDVSFIHSLNITERFTEEGLQNGGFGLQTLCLDEVTPCRGSGDEYASGFGFIGNLELDDGTAPLSLAIATQYSFQSEPELKIFTTEDAVVETDEQGRQSIRADAAWVLSSNTLDFGTIYAVKIGEPRLLTLSTGASVSDFALDTARQLEKLRGR